jgi:hypothetical protein
VIQLSGERSRSKGAWNEPSEYPFHQLKETITALESSLGLMNESLCLNALRTSRYGVMAWE